MPLDFSLILNVWKEQIVFWATEYWWFWIFLVLFWVAKSLWLAYVQEHYKQAVRWTLLELFPPREVKRSPKAMEQVFMAIHAVRNSPSHPQDKWWDGEVPLWFSCELTSFGGEIHIYIRLPARHRNMVEAAFYAQYPDMVIQELGEDYLNRLPKTFQELNDAGYNLFGNELILEKADVYPIRTYEAFETQVEEKELDPISTLLEMLAKVKPRETLLLQVIVRPTINDAWKKSGEALIKELKEKSGRRQVQTPLGEFVVVDRSPGEIELMKSIERNVEKPGFHTLIRYLYFAPGEIYDSNFGQRAPLAALNQYMSEVLNRFRHNIAAWTRTSIWFWPVLFPKRRAWARKERIYESYRIRKMYGETFTSAAFQMKFFHWGFKARKLGQIIMSTEEVATLFHLPTRAVLTGSLIKRAEARTVGPPVGLPIFKEGETELPGIK